MHEDHGAGGQPAAASLPSPARPWGVLGEVGTLCLEQGLGNRNAVLRLLTEREGLVPAGSSEQKKY